MTASPADMERILVVDDEPNIRELIADTLRIGGYDVTEVSDGRTAFQICQVNNFALIVLDVNMPGLDGFDTIRELRGSGRNTPIILLTARGDRDDVATGFELGVDDYLRKPFNVRELCYRVDAVLRRSGAGIKKLLNGVGDFGPLGNSGVHPFSARSWAAWAS